MIGISSGAITSNRTQVTVRIHSVPSGLVWGMSNRWRWPNFCFESPLCFYIKKHFIVLLVLLNHLKQAQKFPSWRKPSDQMVAAVKLLLNKVPMPQFSI